MTASAAINPVPARLGGWLLTLSLLGFVLVPVTGVIAFSQAGVGAFSEITREQMHALGAQWSVAVLTVFLASLIGGSGVILVALQVLRLVRGVWPVLTIVMASVSLIAAAIDAVLRLAASAFTEARLGDNSLFRAAEVVSNISFSSAALAIVLLAASYFVSGLHRSTGVVVGALGTVLFIVSLFAYAFVPPFALALLWLPLGIVWLVGLRRRRKAES